MNATVLHRFSIDSQEHSDAISGGVDGFRAQENRPEGSRDVTPQVNRRELISLCGAVGAAAGLSLYGKESQAQHVELGRFSKRPGVSGKMTGAQAVAASLRCEGVPCVFGIPGAQNNELWDAMKAHFVPYLLVANEFSASIMADASARATGCVGVFSVVPGPGLTNALTGIGEALHDSVPIVGIITDIDRAPHAHVGQVHGLANAEIVRPVVKMVYEVQHQAAIPEILFEAFQCARAGEPGPVAVVIPYTLLSRVTDYDKQVPPPPPVPFDEHAYCAARSHLMNPHHRAGIYAGMGCANASPALTAVAELLQAPVATSVSGKGAIPDGHPLAVGWGYGRQGTRTAEEVFFHDVNTVLAIGVRYSEVSTANYAIPKHDMLIHVDINPQNLGRNVHTDVMVCSDARVFLDRLLIDGDAIRRPPAPALWKRIHKLRQADRTEAATVRIAHCVDPMYFLSQLRAAMGPDELFFIDVTASTHWASETIDVPGPRRYFTPADNQSMGWAIPAAIGAQRVRPDRQVACVTGDGCFLMSAIEMSTAARAGLPVKFFVFDDGAYHYMQMLQEPVYRRTTATDIARIDYAAFAHSVGIGFNQISENVDALPGIWRALACPGPILTRVVVSYEGRELRWLSAIRRQYLRKMAHRERLRVAARVGIRTLEHAKDSD
jgi:acetolactate synthase-1/2/3 large subunit